MVGNSCLPKISLSDFDYHLPKSNIAEYPLSERSDSKLLYADVNEKLIKHTDFKNIVSLIPPDSHLIYNSTKVISARLIMQKPSGGKCELLLVDAIEPSSEPSLLMSSHGRCVWNCMIGGRRVNVDSILLFHIQNKFNLSAKVLNRSENYGEIEFQWDEKYSFSEMIADLGLVPLPPYIERNVDEDDKNRYQTVYAKSDGSVAAPTAGLHFTDEIINKLSGQGVLISELTLHVGPGTFLPVATDDVTEHKMHDEMFTIDRSTILAIIESMNNNKNIIAVGTTSVRTLESLFWAGIKLLQGENFNEKGFHLEQDEPYKLAEIGKKYSAKNSYNAIIDFMDKNKILSFSGRTKLFIMPGYDFKIVNGIITNFHLPKSTLILLVAAFTGKDLWRKIYDSALENEYRFLSYGDSSFLFKSK